jgi:DNA-binding NarL/FixJ family response regulator
MEVNNKIRILIVDDHLVVRVGLRGMLELEPDMEIVAEAKDGQQAIQVFRECNPDVTLMDVRMPGMDGIEAISTILKEAPEAKIIVLSTYDGDEDIHRALQAGAKSYLLKQALHKDLLQTIRKVYEGKIHLSKDIESHLANRSKDNTLTIREIEVLENIAKGHTNKEIAKLLGVSEATIKFHIINILGKLGVNDRTLAVTTALRRGIIHLS